MSVPISPRAGRRGAGGGRRGDRLVFSNGVVLLAAVVIDAHLAPWERRLQDPEGPLLAMRSTATVIGPTPPGTGVIQLATSLAP